MSGIVDHKTSAVWLEAGESPQWDEFVGRYPRGVVYHLSGWKDVLEQTFPHIRGRFLALRDNATGCIRAGLPVYTVRSWLLGNRAVSVPFASFCDPLIGSAGEMSALLPSLTSMLRQTGSKALEIRALYNTTALAETNLIPTTLYKHHYIPLDKELGDLFKGFSESCVRRKIARARKCKITIEVRDSEADLRIFYEILTGTRRRLAVPPLPFRLFQSIWRHLPTNRTLFIGLQNGVPIGCLLVLNFRDVWAVEYSGDSESARSSGSGINQLLYWEAIQMAQSRGARRFSLGRTSIHNDGLLAYKRRWATVEEDLTSFKFPAAPVASLSVGGLRSRESSGTYRLLRTLIGRVPWPVYRMIGNFCYRHLG